MNTEPIDVGTTLRGAHLTIGVLYPQRNGGGIFRWREGVSCPSILTLCMTLTFKQELYLRKGEVGLDWKFHPDAVTASHITAASHDAHDTCQSNYVPVGVLA